MIINTLRHLLLVCLLVLPHSEPIGKEGCMLLHRQRRTSSTDKMPESESVNGVRQDEEVGIEKKSLPSEDSNLHPASVNVSHIQENGPSQYSFKLLLLVMMVFQNSSAVLVGRYTRSAIPQEQLYQVSHLVLVSELAKFVLSCGLEFWTTQGKFVESFRMHNLERPLEALKIMIPALLYLVQNTLLYVALSNLTAPIFQVTYQCKLVTTAIASVFMLQRSYNVQQWICLVGISFGVAIVVLGERKADEEAKDSAKAVNLGIGLTSVTIACMSSALAGVYFEKVLKHPPVAKDGTKIPNASVWMRNMQLSFFSVIIASFQGGLEISDKPFLHGFGFWVWVLVALQSGGGLLVAAVIKYADNVLKGLATGVSVVLSSAVSMLIFATPLGPKFLIGGTLIITAVWFFSNPLPTWLSAKLKTEAELTSLIPK